MMVSVRQRDGDGMTAGFTGSSGVRRDTGKETEVPFDPEATGIIPRLGLDASHPGPTGPDNPPSDDQEQARPEPPAQDDSKSPTDTAPAAQDDSQPSATSAQESPAQDDLKSPARDDLKSSPRSDAGPSAEDDTESEAPETTMLPRITAGSLPSEAAGTVPFAVQQSRPTPGKSPASDQRTASAQPVSAGEAAEQSASAASKAEPGRPEAVPEEGVTPREKGVTHRGEGITRREKRPVAPEPEAQSAAGRVPDAAGGVSDVAGEIPDAAGGVLDAAGGVPEAAVRTTEVPRAEVQSAATKVTEIRRDEVRDAGVQRAAVQEAGVQRTAVQEAEVQEAGVQKAVQEAGVRRGGEPGGLWARLLVSAPKWLPVLLVFEGLIMYVLAIKAPPGPFWGVDPEDINGIGLIAAMPPTAFLAILIMIASFFVTVAQSTDRKFLLLFQIAAITFALHGVGALVAEEPRFPTAYIHAGFVEFIGRTGETAINLDARMAWPGFFALFAFVTKSAGIEDLTPILNWSPLLSNLLYLLPFVLILRQVVATTRARWFAALLFILVQWIGQDYFSPQGFTFALYLVFVAILLRWFGRVEPRTKPIPDKGLRRLIARLDAMTPGELANTGMYRADKLLMLMLLMALFVASTASHQITPFMMLGVLTAFLLFKRTSLTWGMPFFLGMVVAAWISYMAVSFWVGQIETIFGGLGRVLDNLQTNTGDRIAGTDPLHALVLQARLGILVMILALAAVGIYRRLHRGVFDRAALILLCVPALALAMQSYGGEMGLRIYMFALPGACLLAAYAFFPNLPADSADVREETVPMRKRNVRFSPGLTRKISLVLAACMAVVFAGAFLVARYGNEKFERVTSGEVAAMHYVYEHDKPSARVLYMVPKLGPEVTPILPWGERDIELVDFSGQALVHKDPTDITDVIERLRPGPDSPRNTYLAVSRGQISYLQLNEGYPKGWGEKFRAALDAAPELEKVYANKDAALYTWREWVRGTEIPDPRPYTVRGDPTSPWTPVGIAALVLMWITLFSYEVIRLHGPDRAPRARRWMLGLAVPSFTVALAVIVERFIYIAGLG